MLGPYSGEIKLNKDKSVRVNITDRKINYKPVELKNNIISYKKQSNTST